MAGIMAFHTRTFLLYTPLLRCGTGLIRNHSFAGASAEAFPWAQELSLTDMHGSPHLLPVHSESAVAVPVTFHFFAAPSATVKNSS